jgi:MATE family multidrug resistance protein
VATLFTSDPDVARYVLDTLSLTSLCILLDGLVTTSIGVVKGIGKQAVATCAYVVCFYLISVPASYYLCFNLLYGLKGLWLGQLIGLFVLILSLWQIIRKANWLEIAQSARDKYLKESS